jgi:NRPS condensation-like uncharacterized protein
MPVSHSIPRRLPAPAQDRMVYSCRYSQHEHGNFVLAFDGRLDEHRLRDAMRLAMDAEPVFGCRYVPGRKPYWERRPDLDSLPLCTLAETADFSRELERFVDTPCDGTRDPLLSARIVRGETDALLLKTSHLAADGAGSKEILSLIARLYRNPELAPHQIVPNRGCRGARQLFREIGWRGCLRIFRQPFVRPVKTPWPFPAASLRDQSTLRPAIRRLKPAAFDALRAFGKRFGATLNDVFVAACFRALWRSLDFPPGIPQSITIPSDLRRYLRSGETEAICNFVVPLHVTAARAADEPFEETLIRVRDYALTGPVRRDRAVAAMIWVSALYKIFLKQVERSLATDVQRSAEMRTVVFTNLGAFEPDEFDFGVPLTDIYRLSHAAFAPGLIVNVSSFRKKLTFAINYPSRAILPKDIERFLDIFVEELGQATGGPILLPATPETAHPDPRLPNTK